MHFHSPVIFVSDIERSKKFYCEILGQKTEHDFGKNLIFKSGLTIWEVSSDHLIGKKLKTKSVSNSFELYFETDQIEEKFAKLKQEDVRFLHELYEESWGQRTIRFFDPDSHLIEVGEPLETFVINMHKKGFSEKQITKKSGIPLETVNKIIGIKNENRQSI
jgi:catechol 2,3-dioxygenase-like lactoylglutathione lyase family enzyme